MRAYLKQLKYILDHGTKSGDRTGTGTLSVFGIQYKHNLSRGFPLLTTKRVPFKTLSTELQWFLLGRTDNQWLNERGVHIWDEWATAEQCAKFDRKEGDLGPVYGHQWRNFGLNEDSHWDPSLEMHVNRCDGFDQIKWVIDEIRKNPNSRRLIVSGWNPAEAGQVALPPCHTLFQFYVRDGKLSCKLYQRSADFFLGVPFNLASYALLTHVVAKCCNLKVGEFIHSFGDAHIYLNHLDQVREQLSRTPGKLPKLVVSKDLTYKYPYDMKIEDLQLTGYTPQARIEAPISV
jgi:thymidylate synthase